MSITLARAGTTVTLPDDLLWADQYTWQPVEQKTTVTLTGAVVVESAARTSGRPITLESGADRAWVPRTAVDQLAAWAAVAGATMTLNIRGTGNRTVVFRHEDGALQAEQVLYWSQPSADWQYRITLRLLEV
jgi:hypothetical protein